MPFVPQDHAADCGAACLAMSLAFHGHSVTLDSINAHLPLGRDGASALDLTNAAAAFGLRGRGVEIDVNDLPKLPPGTILHWRMNHFVVLDRVRRRSVRIVDPQEGPRDVHPDEVRTSLTGVALVLEPTSHFVRAKRPPSLVWTNAKRALFTSGLVSRIVITSLIGQSLALSTPVLIGALVDRIVPRQDLELLVVASVGTAVVACLGFATTFLRGYFLLRLRTIIDLALTRNFFDHLLRLPFCILNLRRTGDLTVRLNSNVMVREALTSTALSALLDGALALVYLIAVLLTHFSLGLVVVGLGFLRVLILFLTRHRYRDLTAASIQAQARSSSYQVQALEGVETLKAMGAEHRALSEWNALFIHLANSNVRRATLQTAIDSSFSALSLASPLALLCVGAWFVIHDDLTLGTMLAIQVFAVGYLAPLSSLTSTLIHFQGLQSYTDRIDDILRQRPEPPPAPRPDRPAVTGLIEFQSVTFSYPGASEPTLQDISITIEPRQRVAIVGRSGSGKTTLARLFIRLLEPTSGVIRLDGRSLTDIDHAEIRGIVGFVPQTTFLFGGSIRDNIAFTYPSASMASVRRAARRAHIAHEIEKMPFGYRTPVSPGGTSLSGGQAQRIALARALLRSPGLLVLDEATSNVDSIAERHVQAQLQRLCCTQVIVAHRLSTICAADKIMVLDKGRLVEAGTHEELVRRDAHYARLLRSQLET